MLVSGSCSVIREWVQSFHKGPQWVDNKPQGEHGLLWRLKWGDPTPSLWCLFSVPLCSTFSPPPKVLLSVSASCCCILFLWICVIRLCTTHFLFFSSVSTMWLLTPYFLLLHPLFIFCGLQSISTPSIFPHSASYFIPPLPLSPSLPFQLWQRMISPPYWPVCPGCPGQELLLCGGSRGCGWGLGGDLTEMDLIWITRAETPAVCMCRQLGFCVLVCLRAYVRGRDGSGWGQKCRARAMWIILD